MAEFRMPSLGADMDEGTLVDWLVAPGDTVHRGQVVAVVDTAKSAIEVEVFADGVVEELLVPVGSTVPVGTALARLGSAGARLEAPAPMAPPAVPAVTPEPALVGTPAAPAAAAAAPAAHEHVRVSPIVRHLAHDLGVDLATVHGSGRGGAPTRADVVHAAEHDAEHPATEHPAAPPVAATRAPADAAARRRPVTPYARRRAGELGVAIDDVAPGPDGVVRAAQVTARSERAAVAPPATTPAPRRSAAAASAAMRQAIANLMARSKREIPHYYLQSTIDLSTAMTWLARRNAGRPVTERMIPAAVLLKAAALSVSEVPDLNGFCVDGVFTRSERVHLGVAIALRGGGLIAPAIHDADRLPLDEVMAALKDLVARTRSGRLRGSEMSDPTITVTNLGEQGSELVHGVIYPPQVALVGFGRVVDRPWAVDGMLAVRPVVTATLAADHRVTDGRTGSRYLVALESWLNRPEEL